MEWLKGKRVLITGGTGFIGKTLTSHMMAVAPTADIISIGSKDLDLTDGAQTTAYFKSAAPFNFVFHLAGYNGGISFNLENNKEIFRANTAMALNVVSNAAKYNVNKLIGLVASCAYPDDGSELLEEDYFLSGLPNETVIGHGMAKRNLQLACQFYSTNDFSAITLCPTTVYGPGDTFDVARSKVVGGLVARFCQAKKSGAPSVTCLGTGAPLRELIYVDDLVRYIVRAAYSYEDSTKPLNLGSGREVTIKQLAERVAAAAEYTGEIKWSNDQDGQLRKRLSLRHMKENILNFPLTPLPKGLQKTVEFYRANNP